MITVKLHVIMTYGSHRYDSDFKAKFWIARNAYFLNGSTWIIECDGSWGKVLGELLGACLRTGVSGSKNLCFQVLRTSLLLLYV